MRKMFFCICENKGADQLPINCAADQRICFRYIVSTIPPLPKSEINFKPLAIFCGFAAGFLSDLVGNPEDRFSCDKAHFVLISLDWGKQVILLVL